MKLASIKTAYADFSGVKRIVLSCFVSAFMGFLLSRTLVFHSFMPFGYAFCAALPLNNVFSALFGVIIGSLVPANGGFASLYIGLAVLASVSKAIILSIKDIKNSAILSVVIAASCSAFGSLTLILSTSNEAFDYIRMLGELLLSCGGAYFINQSLPLLTSEMPISKLSSTRLCALIFSVSLLLMSLADFTIFSLSPSRIFAVVIILLSAQFGGVVSSVICATSLGFAMSVSGENLYYIVGAYALGGMLSGMFSSYGKSFCIFGFALGFMSVLVGFYEQYSLGFAVSEIIISFVLFLAFPRYLNKIFLDMFAPAPSLPKANLMRKNLVHRLKFASGALKDVSQTVSEVGEKLDEHSSPNIIEIFEEVERSACKDCGLRLHCFQTQKAGTYEAFSIMIKRIKRVGKLQEEDLPKFWSKRCLNTIGVADCLYINFEQYDSRLKAIHRVGEIRSLVSSQMGSLSLMLHDLASELNSSERFDTETASRIDTLLRSLGVAATDITCKIDRNKRLMIEISAKRQKESVPKLELVNRLSTLCNVKFSAPCVTNAGQTTMISLCEKPLYRVDIGVSQINCGEEKLCGDTYSYFDDGKGNFVIVLSDGMGSGMRACVDSTFVSNLVSRLVKAGFGFECALRLVNSAMIFKSSDESLATVDIANIDLYSGKTTFFKAGTPATLIMKNGKVGFAYCNTYPAGILEQVNFDKTSTSLEKGSVILMFSDGVSESECEWLENELISLQGADAKTIAGTISAKAKQNRNDGHDDDITVICAIIENEF